MTFYLLLLQLLLNSQPNCTGLYIDHSLSLPTEKVRMVSHHSFDEDRTVSIKKDNSPSTAAITMTQRVSVCRGEGYFVGGKPRFVSGVFRDTLSTSNGRDSIIVTQLSVLQCEFTD